ncbi:lipase family protein [Colwellia psychrerythraea]|uniref:Lipase class 3 n=1 Tax=Colwellia psychrerythraea TaxID=28229 RepID=A0A099L431_COLPS|nr:lipase family protein [Colwellia psychrerythraea]KGJ96922.1 lipase class 3 [Colwellia psychrerythraea]
MSNELKPELAASVADKVYAVNSGDSITYKAFLANKIFSSITDSKVTLNATVGGKLLLSAKDGFGICSMGGKGYEDDLFLIFRGTTTANNKADFVTDGNIGLTRSGTGHMVHVGFNDTFNSMLPQIKSFLAKNKVTGTVHCIGHSLGGAVASLAADWLKKKAGKSVKLYTFGAPRVGTYFFAKSTTENLNLANIHRVYHQTDPVPMVALFPFMQAPYNSSGHFLPSAELVFSGAAHKMGKYLESVNNKSWRALNSVPDEPYDVEWAIEQWLNSKRYTSADSATFLRWAESALIYVLKKIGISIVSALQGAVMGVATLADKLAYILSKGIDLADNISYWVIRFMRRIMQALGMKVAKSKDELTRSIIRTALLRLTRKNYDNAQRAIRKL